MFRNFGALILLLFVCVSCESKNVEHSSVSKNVEHSMPKPEVKKTVLKFTAIPDQDATALNERFGKMAKYLEDKLGVSVEYVPVKDYPASVTAFKNNDVQLAWFGGLSGVKARASVKDSKAIAQGAEDVEFITYFIANNKTGLKKSDVFPKEMAGRTFTFGSKGSTSGRLMPEYYIRKETEKAPDAFFSKVGFSGDHSKTLALVKDGTYEVGALNYKVYDDALAQKPEELGNVTLIWQTPPYPDYNWTIRGDVDQIFGNGFEAKVQKALLTMTDEALLGQFNRSKFIKADNSMYTPILQTGRTIGILD